MTATTRNTTLPLRLEGFGNLADLLDYAAEGVTGYNFYNGRGDLETRLPYALLREESLALARRLAGLGLARGDRVAIVAETDPLFHRFFFACQYGGWIPVALPAGLQLGGGDAFISQIRQMLQSCGAAVAVAPHSHSALLLQACDGLDIKLVGGPEVFDALPEIDVDLRPTQNDEPAYLQYTSGSTAFPRGVEISQRSVLANLREICEIGLELSIEDRFVSWLPFYHDMGLVGFVLVPLAAQLSADYLSPRTFATRPRLWLKVLSENRGTVSSSPPFGYALCAKRLRSADSERYDLSAWRAACVGAERIHTAPLQQFAELLAPSGFNPTAFVACYGMAECALAVSFAPLGIGIESERIDRQGMSESGFAEPSTGEDTLEFVDCGAVMPSYEFEIIGDDGSPLPERRCGHICLRGPSVMTGYFHNQEATDRVLNAAGWLDTGDIGYRVGRRLFITARSKDVIIVNGRNIWPQDLELEAEALPEVRLGNVSAFAGTGADGGDTVILVVESRQPSEALAAELVSRIQRSFGITCEIDLVPPRTLPRTSSGKLSRSRAKQDYLERQKERATATAPKSVA